MKRTINIKITVDSETAWVEAFKAFENKNEVREIIRERGHKISICDATEQFSMMLGLLLD